MFSLIAIQHLYYSKLNFNAYLPFNIALIEVLFQVECNRLRCRPCKIIVRIFFKKPPVNICLKHSEKSGERAPLQSSREDRKGQGEGWQEVQAMGGPAKPDWAWSGTAHANRKTGRSAIHKLEIGWLVVGWAITSEYQLLYVFVFLNTKIFSPGTGLVPKSRPHRSR